MSKQTQITFLGAAGTVTGSKYLVTADSLRVLVDCGLFQGFKRLRRRNWDPMPFDPSTIDAVLLTHAHIDHSGYLPVMLKHGFEGPVYCTRATRDLCRILLPDSGYLQEEDARYANRKKFSRHRPALPLYTRAEAERSLGSFEPVGFEDYVRLSPKINARFHPVGHILGAACIRLEVGGQRLVFSGDVGRPNDPVMLPPSTLPDADYLIVESTYGNRRHRQGDVSEALADVITRTAGRGGVTLIPSFAVGRAQTLLHLIFSLKKSGRIHPALPVFLNSPMAVNATGIFCDHQSQHRLTEQECSDMCNVATYVNSVEDSVALNSRRGPMIIISASGMLSGGRILHHLRAFGGDSRNAIALVGYQAAGTRGAALAGNARMLRIHGQDVRIRAEVSQIGGLSAHADYLEITDWLERANISPSGVFVTHGEARAAASFRAYLKERLGWRCEIPVHGETVTLDGGILRRRQEKLPGTVHSTGRFASRT